MDKTKGNATLCRADLLTAAQQSQREADRRLADDWKSIRRSCTDASPSRIFEVLASKYASRGLTPTTSYGVRKALIRLGLFTPKKDNQDSD